MEEPRVFDFTKDSRLKIAIAQVQIGEDRARQDFSHVMDLKQSIEENGLLQPIVLNRVTDAEGKIIHHLMAGESRTRACMLIPEMGGMIPYTLFENLTPLQQASAELEENLRRKDLVWTEQITLMEKIDRIKREIYGDQTKQNPDGWSLEKTADIAGVSPGFVSKQVNFAKKLRERPDIKKRVQNLPMAVAIRVADQIEHAEKIGRLHDAGEIKLTSQLHHMDALQFLRSQPADSVDLFLTDPPFGMSELSDRAGEVVATNASYVGQIRANDNSTAVDVIKLMTDVIPELARVLKPGHHFYMFFELELLYALQPIFQSTDLTIQWPVLLWDKQRSTNPFRGYNYTSCYEAILYGYRGTDPRRLADASQAIIRCPAVHATKKTHVFEKPLDLLAGLIKRSTDYGDVVCDPFAGSASTLVAALQCGRGALGSEIDKEHFMKSQGRLLMEAHNAHAKPTLGPVAPATPPVVGSA
jgi:site-specific DNA-methyltransferase (adenine-specific)